MPDTSNGHVWVLFFKEHLLKKSHIPSSVCGSLVKEQKMLVILSHTRCFGQVWGLIVNIRVCWLSSVENNLIAFMPT